MKSLERKLLDQTRYPLWAQMRAHMRIRVWNQVRARMLWNLRDRMFEPLRDQLEEQS